MDYSFNIDVAIKYTERGAIFIHNIGFWTKTNCANDHQYYDGHYWTYNSIKAFNEFFPFWSTKVIRSIIDKLVESGALIKGNYNKDKRDMTNWYALNDEILQTLNLGYIVEKLTVMRTNTDLPILANAETEMKNPICPNGQMQLPDKADPFAQEDNSNCPDGQIIIGTDIKQTILKPILNTERGKKLIFYPPSLSEISDLVKKENLRNVNADSFFNFYNGNGWMIGKNKMKDWKSQIKVWESREIEKQKTLPSANNPSPKKQTPEREQLIEKFKKITWVYVRQLHADSTLMETYKIRFDKECNYKFELHSQTVYTMVERYQNYLILEPHLIPEAFLNNFELKDFKETFLNWFKKQKFAPNYFSKTPNRYHTQPQLQQ